VDDANIAETGTEGGLKREYGPRREDSLKREYGLRREDS
jgi:hypothetical protein